MLVWGRPQRQSSVGTPREWYLLAALNGVNIGDERVAAVNAWGSVVGQIGFIMPRSCAAFYYFLPVFVGWRSVRAAQTAKSLHLRLNWKCYSSFNY